jgi:hypothetical protein
MPKVSAKKDHSREMEKGRRILERKSKKILFKQIKLKSNFL